MDLLEQTITEKRSAVQATDQDILRLESELAALRLARKIAIVELSAFEKAAEMRPLAIKDKAAAVDDAEIKRRGRQPGSISFDWRKTLGWLHMMGGAHDYDAIHNAATNAGIKISLASTRDRVRDYVKQGILDGSPEAGFTVTDDAVSRYSLTDLHNSGSFALDTQVEEQEQHDLTADELHLDGVPAANESENSEESA